MLKKTVKIALIVLIAVLALAVLTVVTLNLLKGAIYSDYFDRGVSICKNPGLSDGFVCQGIAAVEEHGVFIVSGYMTDKSNSRIYITDKTDNSRFVTLTNDGKKYTGHAGGIAVTADTVYIANGSRLFTFSLEALLSAEAGGTVDIGAGTKVNNAASFVYADESYVYVGEYNDSLAHKKGHLYETPEGSFYAIITRYSHDDLTVPTKIYSIRDYVQGVCFTPEGKVVLSTSHGLASSVYYVYSESELKPSGHTLDGADVYFMNSHIYEMRGPAMGEDLDYYDGRVITLSESASNKYIFGKLFFAFNIVGLKFD